ncbi:MAG: acyl carrier protein [Bacteroidetes bacterium]|nr:acyl carrier protein [Bacteroidota bacterium]
MDKKEILNQVSTILKTVFDNDALTITEKTSALDIEEWDSLTHIQVVVSAEKHFKIKFTSMEIMAFKTVGDMCDAVERKLIS